MAAAQKKESPNPAEAAPSRPGLDVALVVALVPVLAAAVRIWMYSGGDAAVFLVLLRTLNLPAVLIATSVLLVPLAIVLGIVVLLTDWTARDLAKSWLERHRWIAPIFPVTFFVLLYTVSWTFLIPVAALVVLVVGYFIIKRLWPWGQRHINNVLIAPRGDQNGPSSILTVIGVLVVFLITPTNMWLPLERIEIVKADHQIAYVLESTSEWTTILTPGRKVEIVPTPEIASRAICRATTGGSIATLFYPTDTGTAPDCTRFP